MTTETVSTLAAGDHAPGVPARVASPCRGCGQRLEHVFVDLGYSPLANSYLKPGDLSLAEKFYPLKVFVCDSCLLVQLEEFESPDHIFSDYAYFSSYSSSWVEHARRYCEMMIARFGLGAGSEVVEIASNDGYLLQHFKSQGIAVLGVEPAANVAKVAWDTKAIPSIVKFFGVDTAKEMVASGQRADVLLGNNVLAHVPDLHDFIGGMKLVLKPGGVITMEFPHLLELMEQNQFDTIYHEHFSYFSFYAVRKVFATHGIRLFDVEQVPTHGGSLRIFGCHDEDTSKSTTPRVTALVAREAGAGIDRVDAYDDYADRVRTTKFRLLRFLIDAKEQGKSVVGYGAPAKGNTLLNYCGIGPDFIDYTVDISPYKQNVYLPGCHIPVFHPDKIKETRPDYVLILPWNLFEEITAQTAFIRDWGGQWVVPIPEVRVIA